MTLQYITQCHYRLWRMREKRRMRKRMKRTRNMTAVAQELLSLLLRVQVVII